MIRAIRQRRRSDEGMTLVELMITSTVLVVLLGMVVGSMTLINGVGSSVTAQYQEFDQALPAMAPFHSLLAAEVEPAPTVANVPSPGFASIGNFAVTFYANIGTAYNNTVACPVGTPTCTGTTAGPAKVVAGEYDSAGLAVTPTSTCSASSPCSLQVRLFLPMDVPNNPGVSTCPGVGAGPSCLYPTSTYRLLVNVQGVVNNPSNVDGTGAPLNPIFTYTIEDPSIPAGQGQSITVTPGEVQNQLLTGLTTLGYANNTQPLTGASSCVAPGVGTSAAMACPLDAIQSVGIDLQIQKPGADSTGTVENSLVVYRYAQSPGSTTAPYQYSATVG